MKHKYIHFVSKSEIPKCECGSDEWETNKELKLTRCKKCWQLAPKIDEKMYPDAEFVEIRFIP